MNEDRKISRRDALKLSALAAGAPPALALLASRGLVGAPEPLTPAQRDSIVAAAARARLGP